MSLLSTYRITTRSSQRARIRAWWRSSTLSYSASWSVSARSRTPATAAVPPDAVATFRLFRLGSHRRWLPPLPPKRGQLLLRLQRWKAGLANIEIVLASFSKSKYNNLIFKWGVINYSTLATHSFLLFNKNNNNIIRAFRDDAKQ